VSDQRLLAVVRQMLRAGVVMPDGTKVVVQEGTPQGGPLSPLLFNIVLDELDSETARRGHRFVRYADDVQIFVRSERAGQRVMASIRQFLEQRMRLKVNADKSGVRQPSDVHFLGFRFQCRTTEGGCETAVLLSAKAERRLKATIRAMTPPNWGRSLTACMDELSRYLSGWMAYFRVCTAEAASGLRAIDAHIRRRLRAIIIHQRKRPRFLYRHLKAPLRSPQPQAVEGVATHPPSGDTDRSEPPVRDAPVRRSAPWPAGSAEPSLAARREAGMGSQPLGGERGEHGAMPNEKGRPPLHGGEEEEIASDHAFVSGADQGEEPRGLVANSLQARAALASNLGVRRLAFVKAQEMMRLA
jgi:RNA-directed DNA polymerase